jgi:hypothetical protein
MAEVLRVRSERAEGGPVEELLLRLGPATVALQQDHPHAGEAGEDGDVGGPVDVEQVRGLLLHPRQQLGRAGRAEGTRSGRSCGRTARPGRRTGQPDAEDVLRVEGVLGELRTGEQRRLGPEVGDHRGRSRDRAGRIVDVDPDVGTRPEQRDSFAAGTRSE